ncbi:MAG TPA: hypothetical protein VFS05_10280 [Gemmatimonadaceae bacterium]|nr:hypothetical protein [Gemmatimonadaceae bacterium]
MLYLQRDEWFPLARAVAVVHPRERIIAYHLLWRDDAHGAWAPGTVATDQEIVWVGYDETLAPTDVWTYWHGTILHADWRDRGQVAIDVQWGKHGSLPRGMKLDDLPGFRSLDDFFLVAWLLPDLWLGRLSRAGPLCFCHGPERYREFTRPVLLAQRLTAVVRSSSPDPALRAVFGQRYSEKPFWPWGREPMPDPAWAAALLSATSHHPESLAP